MIAVVFESVENLVGTGENAVNEHKISPQDFKRPFVQCH